MQSQRPLLPRPANSFHPDQGIHPVSSTIPPPKPRRTAVNAACQSCQLKKVKCDGVRPTCNPCHLKARECVYQTEAGLSRSEDLKRKQEALRENVDSFHTLYQYLQSKPAKDTNDLLAQIRNGLTLEAALDFIKSNEISSSNLSELNTTSPSLIWSQQIHKGNLTLEHNLLNALVSDVAIQALHDGVACFFRYLGTMFPIFTIEEVDEIMTTFSEPVNGVEKAQGNELDEKKVASGELLAICALGFQYDRQRLPSGDAYICTPFYHKARLFLDFVMEKAPLRAMRICCCLGIYNVIAKSALAVSYTGNSHRLPVFLAPMTKWLGRLGHISWLIQWARRKR
jgi:hypothetical protein